jgi:hypothetical protein
MPLYASATSKVGDFPFFYFYLLIYMPVVAIVCWIITLQKRLRPSAGPSGARMARPRRGLACRRGLIFCRIFYRIFTERIVVYRPGPVGATGW